MNGNRTAQTSRTVLPIAVLMMVATPALYGCSASGASGVEVHRVERGEFVNSVTVTGELSAVRATVIQAPSIHWRFGDLKITKIVEDGEQVAKDEVLVEFDPSQVQRSIGEAQSELAIAEAELRKAVATHRSDEEGLEIDLKIAGIDHEIARLNLDQATFKAEIERKQIELSLEKAGIDLAKAGEELKNKKLVNREEVSQLKLKVEQAKSKLDSANEALVNLTVKAPTPGIAVIRKHWTGEKYQVDDQVWSGQAMINLPDLTAMQGKVEISEINIAKIRTGQEAVVRLDAFPERAFTGRVTAIAVLARQLKKDSKVKVFDAKVVLDDTDDADDRLMPGMTVSCEIIVARLQDAVFIPIEALFRDGSETIVYVKSTVGFDRRIVKVGAENDDYVTIEEGLEPGDRVALADPTIERRPVGTIEEAE